MLSMWGAGPVGQAREQTSNNIEDIKKALKVGLTDGKDPGKEEHELPLQGSE